MKEIFVEVFILLMAVLALLLLLCGQQPSAAQPLQAAETATPTAAPAVTPSPGPLTTNQLDSVWGSSASDIFAVGIGGTILHYDGSTWSPLKSGTRPKSSLLYGAAQPATSSP
jgi:hypothetical protein